MSEKTTKELAELITKDSRYNKDNLMTPMKLDFETKEAMILRTTLVKMAIANHLKGTYVTTNVKK